MAIDDITDEEAEDAIKKINLTEQTEFGSVADQIHKPRNSGSKITVFERASCWKSDLILPMLSLNDDKLVLKFLDMAKSTDGWATEKLVQTTNSMNDQKMGMLNSINNKLFTKQP